MSNFHLLKQLYTPSQPLGHSQDYIKETCNYQPLRFPLSVMPFSFLLIFSFSLFFTFLLSTTSGMLTCSIFLFRLLSALRSATSFLHPLEQLHVLGSAQLVAQQLHKLHRIGDQRAVSRRERLVRRRRRRDGRVGEVDEREDDTVGQRLENGRGQGPRTGQR